MQVFPGADRCNRMTKHKWEKLYDRAFAAGGSAAAAVDILTDGCKSLEDELQTAAAGTRNQVSEDLEVMRHALAVALETLEPAPKDFIPYVLTADQAKIAEFKTKFGISQAQAVDELIENTDWGQDVPQYIGHKGTPAERLHALRRALRAGGVEE